MGVSIFFAIEIAKPVNENNVSVVNLLCAL